MRKTFKFRLYPTEAQQWMFEQILNTCRILYNNTLTEREETWKKQGKSVGYCGQAMELPRKKGEDPSLLYIHSQILQDVLRRVDKAFKNFFRKVRNGEKAGYPRFKGYWRYDSFTYPQSGFKFENKKLRLSKIGTINIKLHRTINGEIKTCTIRRDVNRWYACFSVELPDAPVGTIKIRRAVGIDVGLNSLITLSMGEKITPPKFLHKSEKKLAWAQRKLSMKNKGSKNRLKQRLKVACLHRKIRDQRNDFNHKLSRILVDNFDLIAFEDLSIKNMLKNHYLAKSISDASWYQLQHFTAYKAAGASKLVKFAEPSGTSQECSNCGVIVRKSLTVRVHHCSNCGLEIDRDVNSAINILNKILKRIGQELPDLMPVGGVSLETPMNQEATQLVEW